MVVAIGIDLVEIARIQRAVERYGARFLDKVFTDAEQQTCRSDSTYERLAARFAAKEAVMKALGTGWAQGVAWRDIEVVTSGGPPLVALHREAQAVAKRLGIQKMHISLTHAREMAAAVAVGEADCK